MPATRLLRFSLPVTAIAPLLLACTCSASAAQTCDSLTAEIDAKIRAAGVVSFMLRTVDSDMVLPGKVVGSCGAKKIVYQKTDGEVPNGAPRLAPVPAASKAGATAKAKAAPLLTECKDGSMAVGATCGR